MGDVSGCQPTLNSEYFVTASLPSAAKNRRVWRFTTQGTISGTSTLHLLLYKLIPKFNHSIFFVK